MPGRDHGEVPGHSPLSDQPEPYTAVPTNSSQNSSLFFFFGGGVLSYWIVFIFLFILLYFIFLTCLLEYNCFTILC